MIEHVKELEGELDMVSKLVDRQAKLLTGVVNTIRGEPDELSLHSHHDIVELVQGVVLEVTQLRKVLERIVKEDGWLKPNSWQKEMAQAALHK